MSNPYMQFDRMLTKPADCYGTQMIKRNKGDV